MRTTKLVTIFEGVDGSGKTTAAKKYASATGARYVHMGPFKRMRAGVARVYVEAMLPALLGYQDVVLDRSWLSEVPYGLAFRGGADRVGYRARLLERLALTCSAVVVYCDPGWPAVEASFLSRFQEEMLKSTDQLRQVHSAYLAQTTHLPRVTYDWKLSDFDLMLQQLSTREHRHPLGLISAGRWTAPNVVVGNTDVEVAQADDDTLYQWPFASFSPGTPAARVSSLLDQIGLNEFNVLWVNDNQDVEVLELGSHRRVMAVGMEAHGRMLLKGARHEHAPSFATWSRNHGGSIDDHPLFDFLKGAAR